MKAWVLQGNNDIRQNEAPMPTPKEGEVLVRVKAAGICASDISRVYENGAYYYPIILGHEFSGVTEDGRRVGVFPLLPCHKCASCEQQRYETCSHYSYIGSRLDGAYAAYVAVPKWNLIDLPDGITFEQAALLEPAAVALHAVRQLEASVQNAAIIGNGTIGRLIAKWLTIYGVQNVEVLGRNDTAILKEYDTIIEAAGTITAFRRCLELAKPNGQIVLVGNPTAGFTIDRKLYWQILRKQITVKGAWNSGYPSDWKRVLAYADQIHLESFISHRFKFDELDQALALIHDKCEKHLKVVVTL